MAVRTPLTLVGSDFKEMTSAEISAIQYEAIRLYGSSPSVTLSVVSSGGNLGTINDTRQQAGAGITRVDRFATTAELGNVSTITVGYSRVSQAIDTSGTNWNDATYSYPLYYDGSNIREFSAADFADTFIIPAIDIMTTTSFGTAQAGTYFISTATSVTGATLISTTPIFVDTRANASAYTAAGLIETQDQPVTISNYYLHRANAASAGTLPLPICYTKSGINIYQTPAATFRTALQTMIKYYAAEVTGTRIRYNFNGTGSNRGSAMTNTARTGSKYQTYQVNINDYRAQETPDYNVSPSTITTNYLRIYQV